MGYSWHTYVFNRLESNEQVRKQLLVRLSSGQGLARVKFYSSPEPADGNLLSALNLRLPTPVSPNTVFHSPFYKLELISLESQRRINSLHQILNSYELNCGIILDISSVFKCGGLKEVLNEVSIICELIGSSPEYLILEQQRERLIVVI